MLRNIGAAMIALLMMAMLGFVVYLFKQLFLESGLWGGILLGGIAWLAVGVILIKS